MSTSFIAMGIALVAVVGLVVSLFALNFLVGSLEQYFGGPKLKLLKADATDTGFAFAFDFNDAKEPASFSVMKLRLFNPHGKPTQLEIARSFDAQKKSFAIELDMGKKYVEFLGASNFDDARVQVELCSANDGVTHQIEMKGQKFKEKLLSADQTVEAYLGENASTTSKPPIETPMRSFIADTVPGKGAQLAIPTNPAFAHLFAGGGDAGGGESAAQENFAVSKVWIEPGCIVCNACEDIYPEVFDVQADTCLIRPGAPLDDGLKIQDAAEACPVEVIKFTKVG